MHIFYSVFCSSLCCRNLRVLSYSHSRSLSQSRSFSFCLSLFYFSSLFLSVFIPLLSLFLSSSSFQPNHYFFLLFFFVFFSLFLSFTIFYRFSREFCLASALFISNAASLLVHWQWEPQKPNTLHRFNVFTTIKPNCCCEWRARRKFGKQCSFMCRGLPKSHNFELYSCNRDDFYDTTWIVLYILHSIKCMLWLCVINRVEHINDK